MALSHSAEKLRLLKNRGIKGIGPNTYSRDTPGAVKPSDIDELVWKIYEDLQSVDTAAGIDTIDELLDTNINTPSNGQVLTWVSDESEWQNQTLPSTAINDISDVTITTPSTNQVLSYNGSIWVNSTPSASDLSTTLAAGNTSGENNIVMESTQQIQWNGTGNGTVIVNETEGAQTGYNLTIQAGGSNFGGLGLLGHGGDLNLVSGTGQNVAGQISGDVNITTSATASGDSGDVTITTGNGSSSGDLNINLGTGSIISGKGVVPMESATGKGFYFGGENNGSDLATVSAAIAAGTYQVAIGGNLSGAGNGDAKLAYFPNGTPSVGTNYILTNDGTTAGVVAWTDINTLWDSGQTYTPTNVSTDRAYDANATTLEELADVVGTLIADLQTVGIVS